MVPEHENKDLKTLLSISGPAWFGCRNFDVVSYMVILVIFPSILVGVSAQVKSFLIFKTNVVWKALLRWLIAFSSCTDGIGQTSVSKIGVNMCGDSVNALFATLNTARKTRLTIMYSSTNDDIGEMRQKRLLGPKTKDPDAGWYAPASAKGATRIQSAGLVSCVDEGTGVVPWSLPTMTSRMSCKLPNRMWMLSWYTDWWVSRMLNSAMELTSRQQ